MVSGRRGRTDPEGAGRISGINRGLASFVDQTFSRVYNKSKIMSERIMEEKTHGKVQMWSMWFYL